MVSKKKEASICLSLIDKSIKYKKSILLFFFSFLTFSAFAQKLPEANHFIVFYDSTIVGDYSDQILPAASDVIYKVLASNINNRDTNYFSFCTFDPASKGIGIDSRFLEKYYSKGISVSDLKNNLYGLDGVINGYYSSGVINNAINSLETYYRAPKYYYDNCFVLTVSKMGDVFSDKVLQGLSPIDSRFVNITIDRSLFADEHFHEYEIYEFRLYNLTIDKKFLPNTAFFYTDRRTTGNGFLRLFLLPDVASDSLLPVDNSKLTSVQISTCQLSGFQKPDNYNAFIGNWPIVCTADQSDIEIQNAFRKGYRNGDKFPLYDFFRDQLLISDNTFMSHYTGEMELSYILHNDIYDHLRGRDTIKININVARLKKLPFSSLYIDNEMLKKKAGSKIMTQDDVLWATYNSNKWIFIALAATVLLLAAGLIWWIYVGRKRSFHLN